MFVSAHQCLIKLQIASCTDNKLVIQASMPQLPAEFRRQYRELGLPAADVLVLADELPTARYFDAVLAAGAPAKAAANWIMGDIMAFCKASLLHLKTVNTDAGLMQLRRFAFLSVVNLVPLCSSYCCYRSPCCCFCSL